MFFKRTHTLAHISRLARVRTHTHSRSAHSAALFTPCRTPHLPLALFMKACPLSAALSAPSCCGADYPHPEATSFPLFFIFLLCLHPLTLSLLRVFPPLTVTYCSLFPSRGLNCTRYTDSSIFTSSCSQAL